MCLFVENRGITTLTPKRRKAGLSVTSKEKKEKYGERIVALHQLVGPFGKTDTAPVLYEALDYIKFLQDQVKVLTAPYLCGSTPAAAYMIQEEEEAYRYSLRSKGLLLVPASSTTPSKTDVVSSNGIWDIVPLPAENSKRNSDGTVDKYIAPLVSK